MRWDATHMERMIATRASRKVVPKGNIPQEEVGIKDANLTAMPFSDLDSNL